MTRPIILIAFASALALPSVASAIEAKILSVIGEVALERGRSMQWVTQRGPLLANDIVHTTDEGGASLMIDHCVVYLGAETAVRVDTQPSQPELSVLQGQVRCVLTGGLGLRVVSGAATAVASEGILTIRVDSHGTHIAAVRGETVVFTASQSDSPAIALTNYRQVESTTLQSGQEVVVPNDGGSSLLPPVVVDDDEQTSDQIDVETLQDQAASRARRTAPLASQPTTRGAAPRVSRRESSSQNNVNTAPGFGFGFGAFASASSFSAFGGANADNFQRPETVGELTSGTAMVDGGPDVTSGQEFPGTIQLVTAENRTENQLVEAGALSGPEYWSIANVSGQPTLSDFDIIIESDDGTLETVIGAKEMITLNSGQVAVRYATADMLNIDPIADPFTTFGPDARENGALVGDTPQDKLRLRSEGNSTDSASIIADALAELNAKLSHVLGRIRLDESGQRLIVGIRGSDQDRKIEYNSTDPDDVTSNDDVTYRRANQDDVDADNSFGNGETELDDLLPSSYNRAVSLSELGPSSKEAVTRIMASSLRDFAKRTGQTRFVVDGQIIDISGAPR